MRASKATVEDGVAQLIFAIRGINFTRSQGNAHNKG